MPAPNQRARQHARAERQAAFTIGVVIAVVGGVATFCLVVPVVAVLNAIAPHLPWIPPDRPAEPVLATAWACSRLVFAVAISFAAVSYVILLVKRPPQPGEV